MINISVITVVKNNYQGLINTVNSVLFQNFKNFEIIIIDGGLCTDIHKFVNDLNDNRVILIQEKDNGIYDAMNKGIKLSKGQIINFLNADDVYIGKHVLDLINIINLSLNPDKKFIIKVLARTKNIIRPERVSYFSLFRRCPNHQSVFFNRKCFDSYYYNTSFKLASDWAHLYDNLYSIKYVYIDLYLINYKEGGLADNYKSHLLAWKERLVHVSKYSKHSVIFRFPFMIIGLTGLLYSYFKLLKINLINSIKI